MGDRVELPINMKIKYLFYNKKYEEVTKVENLEKAKELWEQFGDISINDNDEIEEPFLDFSIGTNRFEIWEWFEEKFNISVAVDLMGFDS